MHASLRQDCDSAHELESFSHFSVSVARGLVLRQLNHKRSERARGAGHVVCLPSMVGEAWVQALAPGMECSLLLISQTLLSLCRHLLEDEGPDGAAINDSNPGRSASDPS